MQILTPCALGYVIKQLSLADKVKIVGQSGDVYEIEGIINQVATVIALFVSQCSYLTDTFAVRYLCKADLYSSDLCTTRWILAYYRSSHRIVAADPDSYFNDSSLVQMKIKPILSQHDKYRKIFHVTQKLAAVVSELPMREFIEKLATLDKLLHMWEQGNEVVLNIANETTNAGIDLHTHL